jgi:hypothetical protein
MMLMLMLMRMVLRLSFPSNGINRSNRPTSQPISNFKDMIVTDKFKTDRKLFGHKSMSNGN